MVWVSHVDCRRRQRAPDGHDVLKRGGKGNSGGSGDSSSSGDDDDDDDDDEGGGEKLTGVRDSGTVQQSNKRSKV
jgi:hypothetical protein